ncbi:hypothetical protein H8356DRAFT_1423512 [Neocallimastix lanati (nom. inval.)]|nr:hypothetical protein H8356DRAFT_1423512 [Neocallimastix sp. JGI-2020a]
MLNIIMVNEMMKTGNEFWSVNAEKAVKQDSRANASEGEDHNFFQIVNSNLNP